MSKNHLIDGQKEQKNFTFFKFKRMGRTYYLLWLFIYLFLFCMFFLDFLVFFIVCFFKIVHFFKILIWQLLPSFIIDIIDNKALYIDLSAKEFLWCFFIGIFLISLDLEFIFIFLPVIIFFNIFLLLMPGTEGVNKYGDPP